MGARVRTFLLQDWTTIRGNVASASPPIVQEQEDWLDLDGFSDATVWIDVAEVTPPAGTSTNFVLLTLETSPSFDDANFTAMTPALSYGTAAPYNLASTTPIVTRSTQSLVTSNLMRYVRWKVSPSTTGLWDITFRIRVVATRSPTFVPTSIVGCCLWLRSDLGVVANASAQITKWQDQSGLGNDATPGTSPTLSPTSSTGLPKIAVGANQYLTGTLPSVANHTLFAVVTYPSPLVNSSAFAGTKNATYVVNSGFSQFAENPTGIIGRAGDGSGAIFTSAVTTNTSSLGLPSIYSTGAASGTSVDIYINGVMMTTSVTALVLQACANYTLFTLGVPVAYSLSGGEAYEFILYNSLLGARDRQRVHRYLGGRYGILVP